MQNNDIISGGKYNNEEGVCTKQPVGVICGDGWLGMTMTYCTHRDFFNVSRWKDSMSSIQFTLPPAIVLFRVNVYYIPWNSKDIHMVMLNQIYVLNSRAWCPEVWFISPAFDMQQQTWPMKPLIGVANGILPHFPRKQFPWEIPNCQNIHMLLLMNLGTIKPEIIHTLWQMQEI